MLLGENKTKHKAKQNKKHKTHTNKNKTHKGDPTDSASGEVGGKQNTPVLQERRAEQKTPRMAGKVLNSKPSERAWVL